MSPKRSVLIAVLVLTALFGSVAFADPAPDSSGSDSMADAVRKSRNPNAAVVDS